MYLRFSGFDKDNILDKNYNSGETEIVVLLNIEERHKISRLGEGNGSFGISAYK